LGGQRPTGVFRIAARLAWHLATLDNRDQVFWTMRNWRPSIRRYLRFSMRTLLVLMTLLSLWLGYHAKRATDQRAAVRMIRKLGGSVMYDYQFAARQAGFQGTAQPGGWLWLRRLIGDEYFQNVISVYLDRTQVTDDDLILIGRLKEVTLISLGSTRISDAGLEHLRGLPLLHNLNISDTRITAAGLRVLQDPPSLDMLNLNNLKTVDDRALEYVRGLTKLQWLDLGGTSIGPSAPSRLSDLEYLSWLSLERTKVDDSSIPALVQLSYRVHLNLEEAQISGRGLLSIDGEISALCFRPNIASHRGSGPFSGAFVPRVWEAFVRYMTDLNDSGQLRLVDLADSAVTDQHLLSLHRLDNVEAIDLRGTSVTESAVAELQQALPHATIAVGPRDEAHDENDR
jgi:hypothetical protein